MRPQYSIVTNVSAEPVSYAEAAEHIRVDSADDQTYIEGLISVSREYVDSLTGRNSAAKTWKLTATFWEDLFKDDDKRPLSFIDPRLGLTGVQSSPYVIPINRYPLASVTSVKYYAPDQAALTTLASSAYRVVTDSERGLIQLLDAPPSVDDRVDAIEIVFVAGSTATAIHKHAIKLMVANLYEQRAPVAFASCHEVKFTLGHLLTNLKSGGFF